MLLVLLLALLSSIRFSAVKRTQSGETLPVTSDGAISCALSFTAPSSSLSKERSYCYNERDCLRVVHPHPDRRKKGNLSMIQE